ncbi:MAG: ABC-F family ATP-binding cassette domain-containing protein [Planctomycetes bacterium]|nr:ABC-F family ATP-binding cassette domain-containing protein [Planctomycetota bacterium]MBI3835552.1 ABC-F family ATP-binding cassette domain-containing protein [Planctomycetota bacterium]
MAVVNIQNVTKQFGTQIVLLEVSLELISGETVGLVGPNGVGKTTIFRLICGEFAPDLGTVTRSRGTQIGYLKQEPDVLLDRTLHDEVGSVFADLLALEGRLHELADGIAHAHDHPSLPELMTQYDRVNAQFIAAGGHTFEARLNEILGGLGFSESDWAKPMSVLSGGQKCRAALGKLLLEDRELLLLDEPTNHLDIDAVRWLEKFLTGHRGGAVIISHDRFLLDRLCKRILELENRTVTSFSGNYSRYAESKALRDLTRQREFEKDKEFIAKERDYVARYGAGQRARQAKGRKTRLERRLNEGEFVTDAPTARGSMKLQFGRAESRNLGGMALRADDLSMRFTDSETLFDKLSFQVRSGERLAITGPNGTGKTTLLKILMGEFPASAGTFDFTRGLSIGYYSQDHRTLDPTRNLVEEVRAARSDFTEHDARTMLARFLFRGNDVFKPLGALSGGEQSRVRLATLMLTQPDILILDEPTNHLDIASREVLEESLNEFSGTVIAVSHDRYFLDRIADRLLVMRREGCRLFAGNYSFYLEQIEQEEAAKKEYAKSKIQSKKVRTRSVSDGQSGATSQKTSIGKRGDKHGAPFPRAKSNRFDHLSIDQLEEMVMTKEVELARLQEKFGDPEIYKNAESLAELQEEFDAVQSELTELDAAWQERVESG